MEREGPVMIWQIFEQPKNMWGSLFNMLRM